MNTDHWAVGKRVEVRGGITGVIQAVDESTEPSRVRVEHENGVEVVAGTQVSVCWEVAQ